MIVVIINAYAFPSSSFSSGVSEKPVWRLIWNDEFNGDKLDEAKWRAEDAALVKNNEAQYYSPGEVSVKDGLLTIRSRKASMGGREYVSGLVETLGKFSKTYGRFEVRAKLPRGQGIWPAHWLLPDNGTWPPEIDFMEMLGHQPHKIYMSHHWVSDGHKMKVANFDGPDFSEGFHTFMVQWEPQRIEWFIDGVKRHMVSNEIPRTPMRLILNTAVGGNWPGYPDKTTQFPQFHQIDYVRVYERDN